MLKEILSISGRPGLYKLISYGKNLIIVESLIDNKRIPAHSRDKIISLGDIAIYTDSAEVPLNEVLEKVAIAHDRKTINAKDYSSSAELQAFFAEILPDYDKERVYNTDIKKVITWYNILVNAGYTAFLEDKKEDSEKEAESSDVEKAD